MNDLLLITTKGCEACKKMNELILKSLDQLNVNIRYMTKDKDEVPIETLRDNLVTDFPTTLFIKNDKVVDKLIGTKPVFKILLLLTRYFD